MNQDPLIVAVGLMGLILLTAVFYYLENRR